MNNKITFLFGAGAEGTGNYEMKQGAEFLTNAVIGMENKNLRLDALEKFFKNKDSKKDRSYSRDIIFGRSKFLKSCVYNKAVDQTNNGKEFLEKYQNQIFYILSESSRKELIKELGLENDKHWDSWAGKNFKQQSDKDIFKYDDSNVIKEMKSNLEATFENALLNKISFDDLKLVDQYNNSFDILQGLFKKNEKYHTLDLDVHLPAGGLLDSYFHTLINPKKYGVGKFFKVFNYYWFCYFTMIEDIMNQNVIDVSGLKQYYDEITVNYDGKKETKKQLKYDVILNNISQFTKDLYSLDVNPDKNTYYKLIKEKFEKQKEKPYIVTTNYYKFCEILDDPNSEKTVYLNGNLKSFEFPSSLEVKDFKDLNISISPEKLFFPFIWGQSYVKPIVHSSQIHEYERFSEILKDTDILIILGYNINEDDNHINSFLREYVMRENTRLIVVTSEKDADVHEKLRCSKENARIEYCKVNYSKGNKKVLDELFGLIGLKK